MPPEIYYYYYYIIIGVQRLESHLCGDYLVITMVWVGFVTTEIYAGA